MKTIGTHEAKTHLSRILEKVRQGEHFVITHRGSPVAKLIPAFEEELARTQNIVAELRALRSKLNLGGLSVRKAKEKGRS